MGKTEKTERTGRMEKMEKMVVVVYHKTDLQTGSFGIDHWDCHNFDPFGIDHTWDLALLCIDYRDCPSFHHTFNNPPFIYLIT